MMILPIPIDSSDYAWDTSEALALARLISPFCKQHGCFVALTGGCLYKKGARKDCDLLFYRVRQVRSIDKKGLFAELAKLGLIVTRGRGFVHKATFHGKSVDLLFPEEDRIAPLISEHSDVYPGTGT